jgi:hypothetical protein
VDNIPRLLKAFVIAGGVALVGGTVLLVTLLVLRATGGGPGAVDPQASLALPPAVTAIRLRSFGWRPIGASIEPAARSGTPQTIAS